MNEKKKRELVGIVVSDKADKTITVKVETYKKDPLYNKRVKYSKKYSGKELKNKLIDTLLRKGYNYEDIKNILAAKEDENE